MLKLIRTLEKVRMHRKEVGLNSKYVKRNISIWIQILGKFGLHIISSDRSKNDHSKIFLFEWIKKYLGIPNISMWRRI